MDQIFTWVGQHGIAVVLCAILTLALLWLMRHILTVSFPAMLLAFAAEQKAERDTCERRHLETIQAIVATQETIKKLADQSELFHRENRHLLRDLANAAGLREAVRAAEERKG
jgi:hypothetical protein